MKKKIFIALSEEGKISSISGIPPRGTNFINLVKAKYIHTLFRFFNKYLICLKQYLIFNMHIQLGSERLLLSSHVHSKRSQSLNGTKIRFRAPTTMQTKLSMHKTRSTYYMRSLSYLLYVLDQLVQAKWDKGVSIVSI